jgi:hypothetical protein
MGVSGDSGLDNAGASAKVGHFRLWARDRSRSVKIIEADELASALLAGAKSVL